MARLAINPDWSSNAHDPRNAHYLRPLSIVADEKLANGMLLTVRWPKNMAMIELVYGQCLVDARRMLRDREYCELFGGKTISPHHANEQPRAMAR